MTHIVVGTKAQFIKMAPVAILLEQFGWPYRILDLGQHGSITPGIIRDFGLNPDQVQVLPGRSTVTTYGQALRWVTALTTRLLYSRRRLRSELVMQPAGCALLHGDTLSTLLGLHLARRLALRVGLVEAGLTSGTLADPFPEELIRRYVEKRADLLFAPDGRSATHLRDRNLRGIVVDTGYNTGRDALLTIADRHTVGTGASPAFKTVLTLHRAETIGRPDRLRRVIEHVIALAATIGPVRFFLHEPTERALIRVGLIDRLRVNESFQLSPLGSYPEFTSALVQASHILTDGGSIQEEAFYLQKKCLILRRTTERSHGIGENAMLASMELEKDLGFLMSAPARDSPKTAKPTLEAPGTILRSLYQPRASE